MVEESLKNIIVYPTDTVWGIGGNIFDETVYGAIADVKQTGRSKPLSVLFSSIDQFKKFFTMPKNFQYDRFERFCAKESTLLIPKVFANENFPQYFLTKTEHIGVRILTSPEVVKAIKIAGNPIFTTSLNVTGKEPIINNDEALHFFNEHVKSGHFVANEGSPLSGNSSTIVMINENFEPKVIRTGSYHQEAFDHARLFTA